MLVDTRQSGGAGNRTRSDTLGAARLFWLLRGSHCGDTPSDNPGVVPRCSPRCLYADRVSRIAPLDACLTPTQ